LGFVAVAGQIVSADDAAAVAGAAGTPPQPAESYQETHMALSSATNISLEAASLEVSIGRLQGSAMDFDIRLEHPKPVCPVCPELVMPSRMASL
jgi:hypothetical protein